MKQLFNEFALRRFNLLALPFVLLWSLSTLGGAFLSTASQERFSSSFDPFFNIFHLGQKFGIVEHFEGAIHTKTVSTTTLVPEVHRIKAIYRSDDDSFISISNGKTSTVVPLHGMYQNTFRLVSLTDTTALFRGFGKTYRLRLGQDDNLSRKEIVTQTIADPAHPDSSENEWRTIAYQTIANQLSDLQTLGKKIDITPQINGTQITGFRVNSISPDAVFAQMGIVSGDVVQSINNKKLESYPDVLAIISQVPHLRSIRILVLRNNLPKEIVYEITR
jgi:membrane-associated protease RseP (regulator of RpoE activity)